MLAAGWLINNMAKVEKNGLTALYSSAVSCRAKRAEKALLNGLMVVVTSVTSPETTFMDQGCTSGATKESSKDYG